jgi:hypothetical protein
LALPLPFEPGGTSLWPLPLPLAEAVVFAAAPVLPDAAAAVTLGATTMAPATTPIASFSPHAPRRLDL